MTERKTGQTIHIQNRKSERGIDKREREREMEKSGISTTENEKVRKKE